jgi:hypothetical protein
LSLSRNVSGLLKPRHWEDTHHKNGICLCTTTTTSGKKE